MSQFMKTDRTVVVLFSDGVVKTVNTTNPHAGSILEEARKQYPDERKLLQLFDLAEAMKDYVAQVNLSLNVGGNVLQAKNGRVTWNGEELGGVIVDRILEFMRNGRPVMALGLFLGRLMANPSFNSRQQLYSFLEALEMPITERGTFLACKYVGADFKDCYSNTFDNRIGQVVSVPRASVDDNPNHTCSKGLHVGAWEYVENQGAHRMLVEVDPADVVSVPADYDGQKCRVCKYTVVAEIMPGDQPPRGDYLPSEPEAPKHVCPHCGFDLDEEPEWDDNLSAICECPNCAKEICKACNAIIVPDDAAFCAACGADLNP